MLEPAVSQIVLPEQQALDIQYYPTDNPQYYPVDNPVLVEQESLYQTLVEESPSQHRLPLEQVLTSHPPLNPATLDQLCFQQQQHQPILDSSTLFFPQQSTFAFIDQQPQQQLIAFNDTSYPAQFVNQPIFLAGQEPVFSTVIEPPPTTTLAAQLPVCQPSQLIMYDTQQPVVFDAQQDQPMYDIQPTYDAQPIYTIQPAAPQTAVNWNFFPSY